MKKVLHINTNKHWRGGEQQVDYLFNAPYTNVECYLYCRENTALANKNKSKPNIFTFKKKLGIGIKAAIQLKKICNENKIDILHLHDSKALTIYYLAYYFLGLRCLVIIHRHLTFPITSKWKYKHKSVSKIIAVSNAVKKTLIPFISSEKINIIYPAIELTKFTQNNKATLRTEINANKNETIIGIVAALEKEKNIASFLNIAALYQQQGYTHQFVIIGEGSMEKEFKTQYTLSNIHFMGFRKDIENLLPDFDIFLFTSINDSFGIVILEAMAAKVPVVSLKYPAVNELIENNLNGNIANNITECIEYINKLISNKTFKENISNNAYNFVQKFDVKSMTNEIEKIYHQI